MLDEPFSAVIVPATICAYKEIGPDTNRKTDKATTRGLDNRKAFELNMLGGRILGCSRFIALFTDLVKLFSWNGCWLVPYHLLMVDFGPCQSTSQNFFSTLQIRCDLCAQRLR